MPDPILIAAEHILKTAVVDMRGSIEGATSDALNWRPAADDTNSIAVLAVHSMTSTRSWFSVAVGAPLPERDRPSEFRASASGAEDLIAFIEGMDRDCAKLLLGFGKRHVQDALPLFYAFEQILQSQGGFA